MKYSYLFLALLIITIFTGSAFANYSYYYPIEPDNKLAIYGETSIALCNGVICTYNYSITNNDAIPHLINIVSYLNTPTRTNTRTNEVTYNTITISHNECTKYEEQIDINGNPQQVCTQTIKVDNNYLQEINSAPATINMLSPTSNPLPVLTSKFSGTVQPKVTNQKTINPGETKYFRVIFEPTNKTGEFVLTAKSSSNPLIKGSLDPTFNLTGLVADFSFNEPSGSTATDNVGANNGIIGAGTTVNQAGVVDKSYLFAGSSATSFVDLANQSNFDFLTDFNSQWTISLWFKTTTSDGIQFLGKFNDTGTRNGFSLYWDSQRPRISYWQANKYALIYGINSSSGKNDGNWHHLVVEKTSSTVTSVADFNFYFDNNLRTDNSFTTNGAVTTTNDFNLNIGSSSDHTASTSFAGNLDIVGVWTRVLSASEVSTLYNSGAGIEYPYGASSVTDANITFNVYRAGTSTHLTNVTADWNNNAYDLTGQNSPFTQDVNKGNYTITFSKTGYDSNINYSLTADENKSVTIYLAAQLPDLGAPTTTLSGCTSGWNNTNQNITLTCSTNGIDQNQTGPTSGDYSGQVYVGTFGGINFQWAQSFIPSTQHIYKIGIWDNGWQSITDQNLNVKIQTDNANQPSGTDLCIGTISPTLWGLAANTEVDFNCITSLTIGTRYWIVMQSGSSTAYYVKFNGSPYVYANGKLMFKGAGAWADNGNTDLWFKTYYGNPATTCVDTNYRIDSSGAYTTYTSPFTLSTDGNHKIDYFSIDNQSYAGSAQTSYCAVDKTAPTVGATTLSGFTIYSTYIKGTGTIVGGTATDSNSGINTSSCLYSDGTGWYSATWNINHCEKTNYTILASPTTYTFGSIVYDNAGNLGGGAITSTYTRDIVAPTTTMSTPIIPDNNNTATITLICTDAGSGCVTTKYMFDSNGTWYDYNSLNKPTFTGIGLHYIDYNSTDNIGNVETTKRSDINMPILLTIKFPLDQSLLTNILYNYNLLITGVTTVSITNISTDKNVYLKTGINQIFISDINSLYYPSTYSKNYYLDSNNGTTDTIQPYLLLKTVAPLSYIRTQGLYTLLPISNVTIKVYTLVSGINTLISIITTDTSGSASIAMVANQSYTWEIYYLGNLISTQTIVAPAVSGQTYYISINDQATTLPTTGTYSFNVTFTPTNTKLHKYDTNLQQLISIIDTNNTVTVSSITITVTNTNVDGNTLNNPIIYTTTIATPTLPYTNAILIDYLTETLNGVAYDKNGSLIVKVLITTNYGTKTVSYTYNPVNGLDFLQVVSFDLRPMFGCSATNNPLIPCAPLLLTALFISIIASVVVAAGSGYMSMTNIGGLFIFLMGVFTYISWVPYILFAIMFAGTIALMIAEGGRRI